MIAAKTSRRTIRSRVAVARETLVSLTFDATRVARAITKRSTTNATANATTSVISGARSSRRSTARSSLPCARSCQSWPMKAPQRRRGSLLDDQGGVLRRARHPGRARAAVGAARRRARDRAGPAGGRRDARRDGLLPRARPRGARPGVARRPARASCAALLCRELGREVDVETMMSAIRFRAYPDAAPALAALRDRGLTLICVSNWDYRPRRGARALRSARRCSTASSPRPRSAPASPTRRSSPPRSSSPAARPAEALHVGDTPAEDVAGARAAGIEAVLIDRDDGPIASLAEIERFLRP